MSLFERIQENCQLPFFFASTMLPCTYYKFTKQFVAEKTHRCKTISMTSALLSIGTCVSTVVVGGTICLGMKYFDHDDHDETPNYAKTLAYTAITSIGINSLCSLAGAIHGACNNHYHINANETEATDAVEISLSGSTEVEDY